MESIKLIPMVWMLLGVTMTVSSVDDEDCNCGHWNPRGVKRIVGGMDLYEHQYPMMAGIVETKEKVVFCGATIITNKHVITAAHCMERWYARDIKNLAIIVGEHTLHTDEDSKFTRQYKVEKVTLHPQFNNTNYDNDVAIIQASEDIELSAAIGIACLPYSYSQEYKVGGFVKVLGWGDTVYNGHRSYPLLTADVPIVPSEQCQYQSIKRNLDTILCTYRERSGTCRNDDGGPVLWRTHNTNRVILFGIISTPGCGKAPSVNTRVSSFLPFIESATGFKFCKKNGTKT